MCDGKIGLVQTFQLANNPRKLLNRIFESSNTESWSANKAKPYGLSAFNFLTKSDNNRAQLKHK